MIARVWRGRVRSEDADVYQLYLVQTGVAAYQAIAGFQRVHMLRRSEGETTEFVMLTFWDSLESIRAFAGDDVEKAVYYPKDEKYLLELEPTVTHYDVPVTS